MPHFLHRQQHFLPVFRPLCGILFALALLLPGSSLADEFGIMALPSLMDTEMDAWYRIPHNSGPLIHDASEVNVGQPFSLLVFFHHYATDASDRAHLTYDVQIYDPNGNPTEDQATGLVAYQGAMPDKTNIVLNRDFLRIVFTEKYPLGTYKIRVTAYDQIGKQTATGESAIHLQAFATGDAFASEEDFSAWQLNYHARPDPCRALKAITQFVALDDAWLTRHVGGLAFFRRVLLDNPFLLEQLVRDFGSFSTEERKKLLLIVQLAAPDRAAALAKADPQLLAFYATRRTLQLPATDGKITDGDQLDILWAEFLATGRYAPVKKIVDTLALSTYQGTLDKLKAGEIKKTDEAIKAAYLDATYQAAAWSLVSNCEQIPLVFKYCAFIYENEPLDNALKQQLRAVLTVAQNKRDKQVSP
jgi:hypothetical protein